MTTRLGIFLVHDPNGTVDDYILYLLDELRENVSRMAVVCNGDMLPDCVARLQTHADDIFIRDNKGLDCGGFKDAMANLFGWDNVREYDELVLVNDTCFGPLYPLREVFEEMAGRDCDYWAITKCGAMLNVLDRHVVSSHEHIQPYFWVVRGDMLKSPDFERFWNEPEEVADDAVALNRYELRIAEFFKTLGYRESAYIDGGAFIDSPEKNYSYIFFDSYNLVAKHRCPFVKRKVFTLPMDDILRFNSGETARKTLDYITEHTDYPESLIWKHLIRVCEIGHLRTALHLDYVFSTKKGQTPPAVRKGKVAVIAHLYYSDLIENCFKYIEEIPADIDVIVTTIGEENRKKICGHLEKSGRTNFRIIEPENRGRDISALLVACRNILMQYDYLCFVHDKKSSARMPFASTVGRSFMDILWENTLKSEAYIENILACFYNNPHLGYLSPPRPYLSCYFTVNTLLWPGNFDETSRLAERLKLKCKISRDGYPFALGTAFWCRTAALRTLFEYDFQYGDFPPEPMPLDYTFSHAVERIFPYVAQHEGYYSGVMMTHEYASLYAVNFQHMLDTVIARHFTKYDLVEFSDINDFDISAMEKFCGSHGKIYIYGAGRYAAYCLERLAAKIEQFMGYIVSDGRKLENTLLGNAVYELSEIAPNDGEGIIVAMNRSNLKEVLPELEKRGFPNVICSLRDCCIL